MKSKKKLVVKKEGLTKKDREMLERILKEDKAIFERLSKM